MISVLLASIRSALLPRYILSIQRRNYRNPIHTECKCLSQAGADERTAATTAPDVCGCAIFVWNYSLVETQHILDLGQSFRHTLNYVKG